jgi:hypothetical protein
MQAKRKMADDYLNVGLMRAKTGTNAALRSGCSAPPPPQFMIPCSDMGAHLLHAIRRGRTRVSRTRARRVWI